MAKDQSAAAPKKPGRIARIRAVIKQSKQLDPAITRWMALAFVLVLGISVGIGFLFNAPVYAAFIGLPLALLAATIVLSRRAERAAYRNLEGQTGAAGAALTSLRRGWHTSAEPVAVDADRASGVAGAAMIFRAIGRPGVVLIAEGPDHRARKLLAAERKKLDRVLPGVPVTGLVVGDGGGADVVPIRKLVGRIQRMKSVLTKAEVATVNKRMRALGGVKMPLPHGMDPTRVRPDRRSMRGR